MQASIVEEVIAFSALDNLKDLTCMSLLSVCIDNTVIQLSQSCQTKKVIQTFTDYCNGSMSRSKIGEPSSKNTKTDSLPAELLTVERSEAQQEETIISASVTYIHCQLRRLKNNSSILKEAMLTVIPYHRSKVQFTFENYCTLNRQITKQSEKQDFFVDSDWNQYLDEEKMGFIMFECGLEDISLKFVKRCGYDSQKDFEDKEVHLKSDDKSAFAPGHDYTLKKKISKPMDQPSPSKQSHSSFNCEQAWDAHVSFTPRISEKDNDKSKIDTDQRHLKGDASSFIIELKTVWFNFAAPPRTPNTRKIDFTRYFLLFGKYFTCMFIFVFLYVYAMNLSYLIAED